MNKISTFLSLKIFNIRKPIELVFFDILYRKFVLNLKNNQSFIKKYNKDGFVKINPKLQKKIDKICENLNLQNTEAKPTYKFKMNKEINCSINELISSGLKPYLNELEIYYNAKIFPAMINLKRNTFYEKKNMDDENYSDNFHNDAYTLAHFKIFINLTDVSNYQGPMHIISKTKNKEFIKKINYKGRNKYNYDFFDKDLIFVNSGKKYDVLIFDPTQCFHRATIPEKGFHRDYLTITFVAIPKNKKINDVNFYEYDNNPLLRYSKPNGILNVLKRFLEYI